MIEGNYPGFMRHFSNPQPIADIKRLSLGCYTFSQDRQVGGDHRTPDISFKPFPGTPGTAGQSKGPLQAGNVSLNARSKTLKLFIHPEAPNHLQNRKPSFFGERNICYPYLLGLTQIVQRGKASIGCGLSGKLPISVLVSFQQRNKQIRVGRILADLSQ